MKYAGVAGTTRTLEGIHLMMLGEITNTTSSRILRQFAGFCALMLLFINFASELAADGPEAVPRGLVKQTSTKAVEIAPGKVD